MYKVFNMLKSLKHGPMFSVATNTHWITLYKINHVTPLFLGKHTNKYTIMRNSYIVKL